MEHYHQIISENVRQRVGETVGQLLLPRIDWAGFASTKPHAEPYMSQEDMLREADRLSDEGRHDEAIEMYQRAGYGTEL